MSTPAANLDPFIRQWNRIHKQTAALMSVAPSDKFDWKTCDSAMTLGELMNHLYSAEAGIVGAAITGKFSQEGRLGPETSTEAVVAAFDESHKALVAQVSSLTAEQLAEDITPFGEKHGSMSRMAVLHVMHEHEIHHRGQLYVYLRMLGAPVPPLFG